MQLREKIKEILNKQGDYESIQDYTDDTNLQKNEKAPKSQKQKKIGKKDKQPVSLRPYGIKCDVK